MIHALYYFNNVFIDQSLVSGVLLQFLIETRSGFSSNNMSSITSSISPAIPIPSSSTNFIPLYCGGCGGGDDHPTIVISFLTAYCTAGVGRIPRSTTLQPDERSPATLCLMWEVDVRRSPPTAPIPFTSVP
jgi:hypothetical protein